MTPVENTAIKFNSNPSSILEVERFAEDLRKDLELNDEIYGNMLVALTEAANNAIIHGNKCDENKEVEISLNQEGGRLCFLVKDEGQGFDFNNLPDPTAPENIDKPTGRGVFLMKHLSDLVIFSDNGSTLELQFKI